MVTIFQAIIFGLVQGLTEFLPISSSAHLIILPWALHWPDPGLTFDVALHLGTLVAIIAFFYKDIIKYTKAFFISISKPNFKEDANQRLVWFLLLGSIPGALAGFLLENKAESAFRAPLVIAGATIFLGLVLYFADHYKAQHRQFNDIRVKDVVLVGLSQALAIIPGVSRSGVTISAGLISGLSQQSAARFSFLLAIPIMLGAGIFKLKNIGAFAASAPFIAGFLVSAVAGYLAIKFLLAYIIKHSYNLFVGYRILFGLLIIALVLLQLR